MDVHVLFENGTEMCRGRQDVHAPPGGPAGPGPMQDAEHASGSCVVKSQYERFGFDECCESEDLEGLEAAYKAAIEADGCIHTMEDENTLLMHQAGSSLPVLRKLVELGEDPMRLNGLDESVMHMCARWNYP